MVSVFVAVLFLFIYFRFVAILDTILIFKFISALI